HVGGDGSWVCVVLDASAVRFSFVAFFFCRFARFF
ncbi:MAG: hypothetical protein BJ554DRAFT_433, partial [Olpidium bornovanus]